MECSPNRLKSVKHGKVFCSAKCNGLWKSENLVGDKLYNWKGGYDGYYGESWSSAKRKARQRDNHTCQHCKKTKEDLGKNLDVHHIIPFREFCVARHEEANLLYNLICYCNSCHKIIEEKYNKSVNSGDHYSI